MFPDHGCHGDILLGDLPADVRSQLERVPGEWLEYDSDTDRIVVRHAQPSSGPDLPMIVGELVQLLAKVPPELHSEIEGGELYIHTLDTKQFARLLVQKGGIVQLQWAHPDFARASKRPYTGRDETKLDPHYHKLRGSVTFEADDPQAASRELSDLAENFEGLYPEGGYRANVDPTTGRVEFTMKDFNLDAHSLIETLQGLAKDGTLEGRFTVSAFGRELRPEECLRVVFEAGETLVQNPVLWP